MKFVGHTRYSLFVPDSGAWKASNGSRFKNPAEYKEYLFSDDRMDLREEIFLEDSVPALASAAKGYDMKHVVSFSESLPTKRKVALENAAKKYPFLVLEQLPDGKNPVDRSTTLREYLKKGDVFGEYRLDDDDILAADYFERMSEYVKDAMVGYAVSFPLGIEVVLVNGKILNFREVHYPMNAQGLLYICKKDNDGFIHRPSPSSHTKVDRHNPTVIDSRNLGYLRFNHTTQDNAMSSDSDANIARIVSQMEAYPTLRDGFSLQKHFPTVLHRMVQGEALSISPKDLVGDGYVFAERAQIFEIQFEATFSASAKPNQYLLSFDLVNSDGTSLELGRTGMGLGASTDPMVGYYRYLKSLPGKQKIQQLILLPEGVYATKAKFVKWTNNDDVEIHSAKLTHL